MLQFTNLKLKIIFTQYIVFDLSKSKLVNIFPLRINMFQEVSLLLLNIKNKSSLP